MGQNNPHFKSRFCKIKLKSKSTFQKPPRTNIFSILGWLHRVKRRANLWWKSVWFAAVWTLWIHRNAVIFKEENSELEKMVELVKVRSWMWLSSKAKGFLAK
ncbi:hypothetical protein HKD37_01G001844 [Glycine soja]